MPSRVLNEDIRLYPDSVAAYTGKGMLYLKLQRWGPADQAFRRAIRISPATPAPYAFHALVLAALRQLDDAESQARKGVALGPRVAETHFALGVVLGTRGRFPEAEESLKTSLRLDPKQPMALAELAACVYLQRRPQEAYRIAVDAKRMGAMHPIFQLLGIQ